MIPIDTASHSTIWDILCSCANMLIALLTIIIVIFGSTQIGQVNETNKASLKMSEADFNWRMKTDFFTEETRTLFTLFEHGLLKFRVMDTGSLRFKYFELDRTLLQQEPLLSLSQKWKPVYTENEVTDLLLNHFEDLYMYLYRELISEDFIYEGFSAYIQTIHKNPEIRDYLHYLRMVQGSKDSYIGFERLHQRMQAYTENIQQTEPASSWIC